MPQKGRTDADDALAVALAAGKTAQEAAAAAGLSERTASRRQADPAFRQKVTDLRAQMVGRALGTLADGMAAAARTLRDLLEWESGAVRLGAARSLLELGAKLRDSVELEERVRQLEERSAGAEDEP